VDQMMLEFNSLKQNLLVDCDIAEFVFFEIGLLG
jgi:hypothetical protein